MPARVIELVLTHDGRTWVARGAGLELRATELAALETEIARALARDTELTVHLRCARDVLPGWTRQYASHYFNRSLRLPCGARA